MNYEFHVGDYVETYSGAVGYIISIEDDAFTWVNHTPIRDGDDVYFNVEQRNFYSSVKDMFVRIGAYDFTKKEKKKIEALTINKTMYQYTGDGTSNGGADYTAVYENTKFQDKMIDKINELVDAVNLLLDKSTELW